MKLRAIIIDDEEHCVETLSYDLEKQCSDLIEIVGTGKNAIEATRLLNSLKPDVAFLDIELPGINGLSLLESYGPLTTSIVFTTAHSRYAVDGYKFQAEGYLLKPIDPDELQETVQRIKEKMTSISATRSVLDERLTISDAQGTEFVMFSEIVSCQSHNNYTIIHLKDGEQKVVSKTLKYVESQLPASQFVRIHHSTIINLAYIKKYLKSDGGQVELMDGSLFGISKGYKEQFLSLFKK